VRYEVSYRLGAAGQQIKVGSVDAMEMSGKDFVGPIVGVFAVGDEKGKVGFREFGVDCV
jgi:hypothetical protein